MARRPHSCANGNRRPYASLGSRWFISSKYVPCSHTFSSPPNNTSQHQLGPPTPQQPEPPCGAKRPQAPTVVVVHRPTMPAAMALGPSTPTPTAAALSTPMAARHPTAGLQEEEAAPLRGIPPPHPPPTHTTLSPLAHLLTNPHPAAHPLPPTLPLKLMMHPHPGKILRQRRRRRHIRVMDMRVVRLWR